MNPSAHQQYPPICEGFVQALWDSQPFQSKINSFLHLNHIQIKQLPSFDQKPQMIDGLVEEIGSSLVDKFKQNVYKQSNQLFITNNHIIEQIKTIKQTLQRLNLSNAWRVKSEQVIERQKKCEELLDPENQIQIVNLRKDVEGLEDLSFVDSLVGDISLQSRKQESMEEKINSSFLKMESTLEAKVIHIQQEFTRRIQQIMKTIKHLISMMENSQRQRERNENRREKQKKSDSFLNKSHHRISSFFRMGN